MRQSMTSASTASASRRLRSLSKHPRLRQPLRVLSLLHLPISEPTGQRLSQQASCTAPLPIAGDHQYHLSSATEGFYWSVALQCQSNVTSTWTFFLNTGWHWCADDKAAVAAAAAAKEAAEEAATGEAAAMLASLASEEHGDETGLQCEEALPAEDQAGKSAAGSPSMPSPAARGAEQHLGWKVQMAASAEALKPAHVTSHSPLFLQPSSFYINNRKSRQYHFCA